MQVSLFKQLLYFILSVFLADLQMRLCDIIYRSLSAAALTLCFQSLLRPLPLPRMLWIHILCSAQPRAAVVVLSEQNVSIIV